MAGYARHLFCLTLGHRVCWTLLHSCVGKVSREASQVDSLLPRGKRDEVIKHLCWDPHCNFTYITNLHHSEMLSHLWRGTLRFRKATLVRSHTAECRRSVPRTHLAPGTGILCRAVGWPGAFPVSFPLPQSWISASLCLHHLIPLAWSTHISTPQIAHLSRTTSSPL